MTDRSILAQTLTRVARPLALTRAGLVAERAARATVGLSPRAVEDLLQVSFRLSLGSIL